MRGQEIDDFEGQFAGVKAPTNERYFFVA